MLRSIIVASLGLVLGAPFASAQTTLKPSQPLTKTAPVEVQEPRDVVDAIYRLAAAELKKPNPTSPFYSRGAREKYFSKGFDLLVTSAEIKAAHDGDAMLDFDPVSASQDAELQKVTLKTDVVELGRAVVSASFANHGQPTVVTYDFVKEDGDWKIDDIKGTTEKEAWSVRKILKSAAKEPKALPGMKGASTPPDASLKVAPPKRPDEKVLEKTTR